MGSNTRISLYIGLNMNQYHHIWIFSMYLKPINIMNYIVPLITKDNPGAIQPKESIWMKKEDKVLLVPNLLKYQPYILDAPQWRLGSSYMLGRYKFIFFFCYQSLLLARWSPSASSLNGFRVHQSQALELNLLFPFTFLCRFIS